MTLTRIGYWRSDHELDWPEVTTFVDRSWDDDERLTVSGYLLRGTVIRHCMGFSLCRFCGVRNGNSEYTDGTFIWPEGLAHYIEEHGVRLPPRIVAHATSVMDRLESEPVDSTWWQALTD